MPHIHTENGQHDTTVSMYIIRRREDGEWVCLLHMHKKYGKLLQIGGHIELAETPWQAVIHELKEESGYDISEMSVLQPWKDEVKIRGVDLHPTPFVVNTHQIGEGHFHTDLCFALVAHTDRRPSVAPGESQDLRWLTLGEIDYEDANGLIIENCTDLYHLVIERLSKTWHEVPAEQYS